MVLPLSSGLPGARPKCRLIPRHTYKETPWFTYDQKETPGRGDDARQCEKAWAQCLQQGDVGVPCCPRIFVINYIKIMIIAILIVLMQHLRRAGLHCANALVAAAQQVL